MCTSTSDEFMRYNNIDEHILVVLDALGIMSLDYFPEGLAARRIPCRPNTDTGNCRRRINEPVMKTFESRAVVWEQKLTLWCKKGETAKKTSHRNMRVWGEDEYIARIKRHAIIDEQDKFLVHYYLDEDHPAGNKEHLNIKELADGLALADIRKCAGPG